MAEEKESFVFYKSFYEALQDLKDKDRLKVYDAICNMALNNIETNLTGISKTIFTLIKPQVLANNRRYENGKKGGRPKKETIGFENKKTIGYLKEESKTKPNVNVNVNVNDNVNVNGNDNAFGFQEQLQQKFIECIGSTNLNAINECISYLDDLPYEVIEVALLKASEKNGGWKYAKTILHNWLNAGIKTLEQVKAEELAYKNKDKPKEETQEEAIARRVKEMQDLERRQNGTR